MDSTPNNGKLLFDVGGTFLKAVIADGNGRFVPDTEYSVPMPSDGPREEIEQALIAAVERGMRSAADRGLRIGCTGIAFPGPFDFGLGIPLMTHKFRNIYGISLLDLLRTRTDVGPTMPVLFMHDVNAAMLGEMRCGNARGFANAALIALGTGLGFACCLDGEVQYGGRLGPHGRRGESGRQGDLCDHRPHAGRGSPRTDPQGTDRVSVAGRSNFPFVRLSRTWLAQRLVWDGVSAEHCSGGTHRTCGFLRTSRTTRRPAAGDVMRRGGADRGSSFPPIRHITYHTRTTD